MVRFLIALLLTTAAAALRGQETPPPLQGKIEGKTYVSPTGQFKVAIPVLPELGGDISDTPNVVTFQDDFNVHVSIAAFPQDATQRWEMSTRGLKDYLIYFFSNFVLADFKRNFEDVQIESAKFVPGMLDGALVAHLLVPGGTMFGARVPTLGTTERIPIAKRGNLLFVRNGHIFVISTELAERVIEGSSYKKTTAEEDDILVQKLNDIVGKMQLVRAPTVTAPTAAPVATPAPANEKMIRPPRAPLARGILAAGLALLALLLAGCVYLRLLEVKRQLAAFDKFFSLETKDGVRLGCLTPVLLTADFRWLGIVPESTKRLGHSEQWQVRWVKDEPDGANEPGVRDVEIELIFTEDKLTRLHIPEQYFALIPKSFLVGLLRGLGSANIDRAKRDAAVSITSGDDMAVARVTATSLAMLLGKPSDQRIEGPRTILRYRYVPTPPGARSGVFDMSFVFDTASGQLVFLQGRSPVGQMSFNFETATTPPAKPKA